MKNKFLRYIGIPLILLSTAGYSNADASCNRAPYSSHTVRHGGVNDCGSVRYTSKDREAIDDSKRETLKPGCESRHVVYFDFNKDYVRENQLQVIKDFIQSVKNSGESVIVVGHTDKVGRWEYNQKLSIRRAEAVRAILIKHGITKHKITIHGMGEKFATENDSQSRRAILYIGDDKKECFSGGTPGLKPVQTNNCTTPPVATCDNPKPKCRRCCPPKPIKCKPVCAPKPPKPVKCCPVKIKQPKQCCAPKIKEPRPCCAPRVQQPRICCEPKVKQQKPCCTQPVRPSCN